MNKEDKEDRKEELEIPFIALSTETTEANKTWDQGIEAPDSAQRIPPCQDACPIGQDIPKILSLVKDGKFKEAWIELAGKNPLLGSTSTVCQGFCQQKCNRQYLDERVEFNKIEKFLGEMALKQGWRLPIIKEIQDFERSFEKKIGIIGAGPTGLTCAYQLARQGYSVIILESSGVFGGLMRTAIPEDRLPRDILNAEINRVLALDGINAIKQWPIGERYFAVMRKNFDAVFVAVGEHKSIKLGIDNEDVEGVIYGLDFLRKFNLDVPLDVGRRVTIVGSGNTAIDCAHCVAKIPNKKVFVFCEKSRDEIPDFLQKGVEAAEKQGVTFFFSMKTQGIYSKNQKIRKVKFEKIKQSKNSGRLEISTNVDNLIIALGEEPDTSFIHKDFASEIAGVFFGGNPNNVASAIASGNEGAKKVIAFLNSEKYIDETENSEVVEFADLNMAYSEHRVQPAPKKITDAETAIKEAEMCFGCGTCPGIDNCGVCKMYCPDFSIFEENKERKLDDNHCKGCGICARECPRGVLRMKLKEKQE